MRRPPGHRPVTRGPTGRVETKVEMGCPGGHGLSRQQGSPVTCGETQGASGRPGPQTLPRVARGAASRGHVRRRGPELPGSGSLEPTPRCRPGQGWAQQRMLGVSTPRAVAFGALVRLFQPIPVRPPGEQGPRSRSKRRRSQWERGEVPRSHELKTQGLESIPCDLVFLPPCQRGKRRPPMRRSQASSGHLGPWRDEQRAGSC